MLTSRREVGLWQEGKSFIASFTGRKRTFLQSIAGNSGKDDGSVTSLFSNLEPTN